MRENQSDSEDGWPRSGEYISPWASREADETPRGGADAAPPPEDGTSATIAFGGPASEPSNSADQSWYVAPDYGTSGTGQGGHDAGGYGTSGSGPGPHGVGGYGTSAAGPGGHGVGGYGMSGPGPGGHGVGGYGASGPGPGGHGVGGYGASGPGQGRQGVGGQGVGGQGVGGYGASEPGQGGYGVGGYGASGYGVGGWGTGGPGGPAGPLPPGRQGGRRRGRWLVYLTVAALAAVVGAGLTAALDSGGSAAPGTVSSRDIPTPSDNATGSKTLNLVTVERKVKPGLVDITATLKYDSETAEGTGMILSPSGLVLTNNHVIDGATSVTAMLVDSGKTFQARVIGYDSKDDIALLQLIGAAGLPTVSFGNSSQVKVGTAVLALGNADGRGGATPAAGIINGLNRSIQASDAGSGTTEDLSHMLETDALIQQGDSGGALANNAGQVIGMVTAANTGSADGASGTTGFAIPIDTALNIASEIAAGQPSGTVSIGLPGFLGVEVGQSTSPNPVRQAIDQERADNSPGPTANVGSCLTGGQPPGVPRAIAPARIGALVLGILCNTAADSQGLIPGDVITAVNGEAVTTPGSLTSITAKYRPGQVVSVSWESTSGARHTSSFTLGSGPAR
jgi:S1-C subfamily serine protease